MYVIDIYVFFFYKGFCLVCKVNFGWVNVVSLNIRSFCWNCVVCINLELICVLDMY